jgi:hypothetical protein
MRACAKSRWIQGRDPVLMAVVTVKVHARATYPGAPHG